MSSITKKIIEAPLCQTFMVSFSNPTTDIFMLLKREDCRPRLCVHGLRELYMLRQAEQFASMFQLNFDC